MKTPFVTVNKLYIEFYVQHDYCKKMFISHILNRKTQYFQLYKRQRQLFNNPLRLGVFFLNSIKTDTLNVRMWICLLFNFITRQERSLTIKSARRYIKLTNVIQEDNMYQGYYIASAQGYFLSFHLLPFKTVQITFKCVINESWDIC